MKIGRNKHLYKANPKSSRARVFISYSFKDRSQKALVDIHKGSKSIDFTDYSIKSPYDYGWKSSAKYRIRNSDMVCVCPPRNDEVGKGMIDELKIAKRYKKPIISLNTNQRSLPKKLVKKYGIKEIPHNCSKLQKEIDKSRKNRKV